MTLRRCHPRCGSILLVVLVVVSLLTLTGMSFFEWSFTQRRASDAYTRGTQARLLAESGIDFAQVQAAKTIDLQQQAGGLYNNPALFQGMLVLDSDAAELRGRFAIVAPALENGVWNGLRFGLENESARLNLNTVLLADEQIEGQSRTLLMALPGMTESIADAILDFIDEDDEPRDFGAEASYYSALTPAYAPPNGPLESVDQLLLVRDVTPELLYGWDRNRNFVIDGAEVSLPAPLGVDNSDGSMSLGWNAYLTLASAEKNLRADGTPKIDVNMEDLQALYDQLEPLLGAEQANFIVAFRQGGPDDTDLEAEAGAAAEVSDEPTDVSDTAGQEGGVGATKSKTAGEIAIDYEQPGSETIGGLLDLVGVNTRIVEKGSTQRVVVETPFPADPGTLAMSLPLLMDNLTASGQAVVPGRLNVNQCPRRLLEGLPGMDPALVEQILGARQFEVTADQPNRKYETWLLTEGILTLEQMKALMPLLTGGGDVYRAQVVGYFDAGGAQCRLEAVIDLSGLMPELVRVRNLTALGQGFDPAVLGAQPEAPE